MVQEDPFRTLLATIGASFGETEIGRPASHCREGRCRRSRHAARTRAQEPSRWSPNREVEGLQRHGHYHHRHHSPTTATTAPPPPPQPHQHQHHYHSPPTTAHHHHSQSTTKALTSQSRPRLFDETLGPRLSWRSSTDGSEQPRLKAARWPSSHPASRPSSSSTGTGRESASTDGSRGRPCCKRKSRGCGWEEWACDHSGARGSLRDATTTRWWVRDSEPGTQASRRDCNLSRL